MGRRDPHLDLWVIKSDMSWVMWQVLLWVSYEENHHLVIVFYDSNGQMSLPIIFIIIFMIIISIILIIILIIMFMLIFIIIFNNNIYDNIFNNIYIINNNIYET